MLGQQAPGPQGRASTDGSGPEAALRDCLPSSVCAGDRLGGLCLGRPPGRPANSATSNRAAIRDRPIRIPENFEGRELIAPPFFAYSK